MGDVVHYGQVGLQADQTLAGQLNSLNGSSDVNGALTPGLNDAAQNAQTTQAILNDLSGLDQSEAFSDAYTGVDPSVPSDLTGLVDQTDTQDQATAAAFSSVGLTNCAESPAP